MAANNDPIFSKAGDIEWALVSVTANTAVDGTGTTSLVFTAGADGGWCEELLFAPLGTNITTCARVFINNGATPATATNNSMIGQITLPATTLNNAAALFVPRLPIRLALPATYRIYVCLATTVAAGYQVTAVGGQY